MVKDDLEQLSLRKSGETTPKQESSSFVDVVANCGRVGYVQSSAVAQPEHGTEGLVLGMQPRDMNAQPACDVRRGSRAWNHEPQ